jgi:hypothetical protein
MAIPSLPSLRIRRGSRPTLVCTGPNSLARSHPCSEAEAPTPPPRQAREATLPWWSNSREEEVRFGAARPP